MNPKLIELFKEYDASHQHATNRLTHKVAIPMIFFNFLVMFDWINLMTFSLGADDYRLSVGMIFTALFALWYFAMSIKLGCLLLPMMVVMLALGTATPTWLVIVLGVAGWIIQMMGHLVWEKNSPNFVTNLVQFLVGPIFFLALVTGDWKVGQHLQTSDAASA